MAIINVDDAYILNETGAEVDKTTGIPFKNESLTEAEAAQARANIRAGGSNPNLLDNAYFVGGGSQLGDGVFPINQRGLTNYTTLQVTIDRWTLFGGSVSLAADGITVTSSPDFAQVFEPSRLPVGTYTASVKTADGKIGSITFTTTGSQFFAGGAMGDTGVTLNFIDLWQAGKSLFSLQCQGVKLAAAKLEKGTVSTLANDPPPDFGEELAKCKRYFERIKAVGSNQSIGIGSGNASGVYVPICISPKRATPTITVSASLLYGQGGMTGTSTGVSILATSNATGHYTLTVAGSFTANAFYRIAIPQNGYVDFSAEL